MPTSFDITQPSYPTQPAGQTPQSSSGGLGTLTLSPQVPDMDPTQKADYYNMLIDQGYSNDQIRQAAGPQTDSDWSMLQDLASSRKQTYGPFPGYTPQPISPPTPQPMGLDALNQPQPAPFTQPMPYPQPQPVTPPMPYEPPPQVPPISTEPPPVINQPNDTGFLPPEARAAWLATLTPEFRNAFLAAHPGYLPEPQAPSGLDTIDPNNPGPISVPYPNPPAVPQPFIPPPEPQPVIPPMPVTPPQPVPYVQPVEPRPVINQPNDFGFLPYEARAAFLASLSPAAREAFLKANPNYLHS